MYNLIAPFYDLTHAQLTADLGLVLSLASQAGGKILELGCGTGRLLLPLSRAGYTVTGLDNSEAMLAMARQKLAQENEVVRGRVTLVPGDMADLSACGRDFSLVIIPYNTFMHLAPSQSDRVLRQIKQSLTPEGQLFIDLINPYAVAQTPNDHLLTLEQIFTNPANGHTVLQFARNHLDEVQQTLHITWIYDVTPPGGGDIHRTIVPVSYHYFFPHQLEIQLSTAGFRIIDWFGNYTQQSFTEESDRLLLLATPSP